MEVLQNFKNLFFDVWNKGISGINISEIIIALLIFLFFLFLRGVFSKFVVKRLENYVSKSTNNFDNSLVLSMEVLITLLFFQWRDQQSSFQWF